MKQLFIKITSLFHPAINNLKAENERLNTVLSKSMTDYGYLTMELNKTRLELLTVKNELADSKKTNSNYTKFALDNITKLTHELAEKETENRSLREESKKLQDELNAALAENRIADTLAVKEKIGKPFRPKKGNKSKQY